MIPSTRSEIAYSIRKIEAILKTDIFSKRNDHHLFQRAVFIEVLILLRDLMYKSEKEAGLRISFSDDVVITQNVRDVSDLIKTVRDALCHSESRNHYVIEELKTGFFAVYGKTEPLVRVGNEDLFFSDYEDDVCFFFGVHKIYLRRHIIRAFQLARQNLLPFLSPEDAELLGSPSPPDCECPPHIV